MPNLVVIGEIFRYVKEIRDELKPGEVALDGYQPDSTATIGDTQVEMLFPLWRTW